MNKSLLIFFAVIAAASALRLPVDLKAAVGKIQLVRQKDAGYESEAMADAIPEVGYESEAMADDVPQPEYESEAMSEDAPRPPVVLKDVVEKIESLRQKEEEYESEHMADIAPEVAQEEAEQAVPEIPYETAAMGEDAPRPPVLLESIRRKIESLRQKEEEEYESEHMADVVPEVAQEEGQAYESEHMAEPEYESKDMADEPYETVAMKDEYENQAMADEELVDSIAVPYESVAMADEAPEPRRFGADGGDNAFRKFAADFEKFESRRFSADGADDDVIAIADGVVAALRRFAADSGLELTRRFQADGKAEPRRMPFRFPVRANDN